MAQSNNYWRRREEENLRANRKTEAEYEKAINDTYKYMLDQIQKEINGFYAKYARAEGITLSEAKRRVSKIDIEEYGRKAARYVKTKDFSKQANDEMRLYNATMKINRLELLKANIGLELVAGFDELQKYFEEKLTNRTMDEFKRQSGILGRTVQNNEKAAHAIVNASFKNATYSDRIWMYQGMLKAELDSLLKTGLIQGKHPTELARHLQKRFGVSAYNANRLMTTELARVQTEAQKQSFIRNGFTQYTFLAIGTACEACRALNEKHFDIDKMMPGENAPPMHPNCRCSVAAYMDSEEYEAWIETYKEHGMSFEEWKFSRESEESKKKYLYKDTVVKKSLLKSSAYRKKFNQISDSTKINRIAWNISKDILKHRSGTRFEDLAFINIVNGQYAVNKDYDIENKAKMNKPMKQLLEESESGTIIAIHNHPGSSVPSIPDIRACIKRGYKKGIIACHDGKVYVYSVDPERYNEPIAMSTLDRLEKKGYTKEVVKRFKDAGMSLEVL